MALRDRIGYLRKEHKELLQLTDEIESALAVGSKAEFPEHQECLNKLRGLEHGFQGIEEHCHAEERVVESTYHHYANSAERLRLNAEHADIERALADFREELRFATADRTATLRGPGVALVTRLRAHIAHEERLLRSIRKSAARRQRARKNRHSKPTTAERNGVTARPSRRALKANRFIPYTMEPHPEL